MHFWFYYRKDDKPESSALVDLLDISFGAASISSPHQQPGPSTSVDPWGVPVAGGSRPQVWVRHCNGYPNKTDKHKFNSVIEHPGKATANSSGMFWFNESIARM